MDISYEQLVNDLARAAEFANENYFGVSVLEEDIEIECSVGDNIDAEQMQQFLDFMGNPENFHHGFAYDLSRVKVILMEESDGNPYNVFWDQIIDGICECNHEVEDL